MDLCVKKVKPEAILPTKATADSAGYDLYACLGEAVVIPKGEIRMIPTGIAAAAPSGTALMIYARSGLAAKFGVAPANCVGVVDSDYRGEIIVALLNSGVGDFVVEPKMRIAQMILSPILCPEIIETDCLSDTERGAGGFGSTGK